MKESIMSFYNAPITNQVPNGVVSIDQLYTYVSTNEWLRERTDRTRVALDDEKRFRQLKQSLLPYVTPAGVFSYRKEDRLLFPLSFVRYRHDRVGLRRGTTIGLGIP